MQLKSRVRVCQPRRLMFTLVPLLGPRRHKCQVRQTEHRVRSPPKAPGATQQNFRRQLQRLCRRARDDPDAHTMLAGDEKNITQSPICAERPILVSSLMSFFSIADFLVQQRVCLSTLLFATTMVRLSQPGQTDRGCAGRVPGRLSFKSGSAGQHIWRVYPINFLSLASSEQRIYRSLTRPSSQLMLIHRPAEYCATQLTWPRLPYAVLQGWG